MNTLEFYRAFEDRYRGSRELVKKRLEAYLPFIRHLSELDADFWAVDLGCGRGEWLELLSEQHLKVTGVDLDAGMLSACLDRDFQVMQQDALEYLTQARQETFSLITGFHLAEHLAFDVLQSLISESIRALKPGGLLILETPNPENIVVASHTFYLDPSHVRPLPPILLSFLAEFGGFYRVKILRLQENPEIHTLRPPRLWDIFQSASADYAIVAQKEGPREAIKCFDALYRATYGLEPQEIAARYDDEAARKINQISTQWKDLKERTSLEIRLEERERHYTRLEHHAHQLALNASAAETRGQALENQLKLAEGLKTALEHQVHQLTFNASAAEIRIKELENQLQVATKKQNELQQTLSQTLSHLQVTEQQASDWHNQILQLRGSWSWRISSPLRLARRSLIFLLISLKFISKGISLILLAILCLPFIPVLILILPFVLSRPKLRDWLGQRISKSPRIRFLLRRLAFMLGFISRDPRKEGLTAGESSAPTQMALIQGGASDESLAEMTPRARDILSKLTKASNKLTLDSPETPDQSATLKCFSGRITLQSSTPNQWRPRELREMSIELSNLGDKHWHSDASHPLSLSYHWLQDGAVIVHDGLRTPIKGSGLPAGARLTQSLLIQAPEKTGRLTLIISLVWEGYGWLENFGLDALHLDTRVE